MATLTPPQQILEGDTDDMEPFFAALRSSNPFINSCVNGLSPDGVDVDDIHRSQFESLTDLAGEARDLRRGLGAMLWGEAGVGKSHLLSRLVRWAEQGRQGFAVYLHNLQASPENLPRSLLKAVVSILTRGQVRDFRRTPLFDLTHALVAEALNHDATVIHPWAVVERAYSRLIDRLSAEDSSRAALVDRSIYDILYRFHRSAYRAHKTRDEQEAALAVRWLSGDALDAAEARQIGLPPGRGPDDPAALADNQQIKQVLVALSRMALSRGLPFLLCFDQVDNLDDDQAAALSRFLEALIDGAPNLLVVTAGIQASLLHWRETKVFQDSAWDRLAQFTVHLLRLTPEEGRRIVAARLEKAVAPFGDLEYVRLQLQQDHLFPLGRAWAEQFFRQKIDWRPRDVINGAGDAWRRRQEALRQLGGPAWLRNWNGGPANGEVAIKELTKEQVQEAIDRTVDQKIADLFERRRQQPGALPADAANLTGLLVALFKEMGDLDIELPPSGKPGDQFPYSLVVRQPVGERPGKRTGLLVLVNPIARSTTYALRRLLDAAGAVDRLLLVSDERQPLAFGAQPDAKGRKYYDDLRRGEAGPFQHIPLTLEQYMQLDALRAVSGMARCGDLEIELSAGKARPVSEREVMASHQRRGRYAAAPVLSELFAEARAAGEGPSRLTASGPATPRCAP